MFFGSPGIPAEQVLKLKVRQRLLYFFKNHFTLGSKAAEVVAFGGFSISWTCRRSLSQKVDSAHLNVETPGFLNHINSRVA